MRGSPARPAEIAHTRWRPIDYPVQTAQGEKVVRGRILLPPDYQPGRRYPMIVYVYPGMSNRGGQSYYDAQYGLGGGAASYSAHIFAAKGYVVFAPSTLTAYIRAGRNPLGGITRMVEQGMDAVIQRGYADPDRLALWGVSQGGFASLWVATESRRFKAVVSLNGWADMYSHYFEALYLDEFVRNGVAFRGATIYYEPANGSDYSIGASPYEATEAYVHYSPLFRATEVSAPVLLIHSDMDTFALSHYERFFTALSLLHKRAQLVRYWGEAHTPSSPGNIRDLNRRMFAWFDDYCDVARDAHGALRWDGNVVRSRQGAPALKPEAFQEFEVR